MCTPLTVKPNTLWTSFHANISITTYHILMELHILVYVVGIDISFSGFSNMTSRRFSTRVTPIIANVNLKTTKNDYLATFGNCFGLYLFPKVWTPWPLMHFFKIKGEGHEKGHWVQKIKLSIFRFQTQYWRPHVYMTNGYGDISPKPSPQSIWFHCKVWLNREARGAGKLCSSKLSFFIWFECTCGRYQSGVYSGQEMSQRFWVLEAVFTAPQMIQTFGCSRL